MSDEKLSEQKTDEAEVSIFDVYKRKGRHYQYFWITADKSFTPYVYFMVIHDNNEADMLFNTWIVSPGEDYGIAVKEKDIVKIISEVENPNDPFFEEHFSGKL